MSDLGNSPKTGLKFNKLTTRTGKSWNQGDLSKTDTPGIYIEETIGGDEVTDYASFKLDKPTLILVETEGAIFELVNSKNEAVASSDDGYSSSLYVQLNPGTYYLHYSSESSTSEIFKSQVKAVSQQYQMNSLLEVSWETNATGEQYNGQHQVGSFKDPLTGMNLCDGSDHFEITSRWNEAVEGLISVAKGSIEVNYFDSMGEESISQTLRTGQTLGFGGDNEANWLEVIPVNPVSASVYSVSWG